MKQQHTVFYLMSYEIDKETLNRNLMTLRDHPNLKMLSLKDCSNSLECNCTIKNVFKKKMEISCKKGGILKEVGEKKSSFSPYNTHKFYNIFKPENCHERTISNQGVFNTISNDSTKTTILKAYQSNQQKKSSASHSPVQFQNEADLRKMLKEKEELIKVLLSERKELRQQIKSLNRTVTELIYKVGCTHTLSSNIQQNDQEILSEEDIFKKKVKSLKYTSSHASFDQHRINDINRKLGLTSMTSNNNSSTMLSTIEKPSKEVRDTHILRSKQFCNDANRRSKSNFVIPVIPDEELQRDYKASLNQIKTRVYKIFSKMNQLICINKHKN